MYKKKTKPLKALTPAQKQKLKEHKKHTTKKHMDIMIKNMKLGKTFTEAHKIAMKK
tara:strand:+ start:6872 stop:7039 length:168 start_codon:yes stop_codon:yes gene_type:complete